jgi:hypothetical protein
MSEILDPFMLDSHTCVISRCSLSIPQMPTVARFARETEFTVKPRTFNAPVVKQDKG